MSDITAYEAAARRLVDEPTRIDRLASEARHLANLARKDHPAGFAAIDAEIRAGLGRAGALSPNSAEQLLCVELLHKDMEGRLFEAEAAVKTRDTEHRRAIDLARLESQRVIVRRDLATRKTADIASALGLLRGRLDRVCENFGKAHDDEEFLKTIETLDDALRAASTATGLEKRTTRARIVQAQAKIAIDALVETAA